MKAGSKSMNSIEDKKIEEFWRRHLAPLAEKVNNSKIKLIDDAKSGSSWTEPDKFALDFETLTIDTIAEKLQERFKNADLDELASLVPELIKLAEELKPSASDDQEIDPYVYVMH